MPKQYSRFAIIWVVLVLALASIVVGLLLRLGIFSRAPIDPYHPAYYGLPEVIAGHKVVMVITPDKEPCMQGEIILFKLQAPKTGIEGFPEDDPELMTIAAEHPNWRFDYVEPGFNRDYAIKLQEARSSGFMMQCPQLEDFPQMPIRMP